MSDEKGGTGAPCCQRVPAKKASKRLFESYAGIGQRLSNASSSEIKAQVALEKEKDTIGLDTYLISL